MNNQIKSQKQSHFIALCITGFRCGETRCRKSWNQFKGYDSRSLRYVKRVSGKRKDHRWEKSMSKFLISEVPTVWNLRIGPMKSLKDSSHGPEARFGIFVKIFTSSRKKKQGCILLSRGRMGVAAASTKKPEKKRVCSLFRSECAYGQ